jgi:hypothetical protein
MWKPAKHNECGNPPNGVSVTVEGGGDEGVNTLVYEMTDAGRREDQSTSSPRLVTARTGPFNVGTDT